MPKFCSECGTALPESSKFCPSCGTATASPGGATIPFPKQSPAPPPMDHEVAEEIAALNSMQPAAALRRLQELQRSNPDLLDRMMPAAQKRASELRAADPLLVDRVKMLLGW